MAYDEKAYQREWQRAYRKRNVQKLTALKKQQRLRVRLEGIAAYGGACTCCGEDQPEFLTLEHLKGRTDQANDFRKPGEKRTGYRMWSRAKVLGWPADYTVLCFNCNCAKAIYGTCPHTWKDR